MDNRECAKRRLSLPHMPIVLGGGALKTEELRIEERIRTLSQVERSDRCEPIAVDNDLRLAVDN